MLKNEFFIGNFTFILKTTLFWLFFRSDRITSKNYIAKLNKSKHRFPLLLNLQFVFVLLCFAKRLVLTKFVINHYELFTNQTRTKYEPNPTFFRSNHSKPVKLCQNQSKSFLFSKNKLC